MAREQFIVSAGPAFVSKIIEDGSLTQVLAVCSQETTLAADLLHLGCSGVLPTDTSAADIRRAVHAIASGELWFPRKIMSAAIRSLLSNTVTKRLTQREKEVLHLIGQGFNNREIAESLFISRETVRWHARSLYSKIGTHDRKRVTTMAMAMAAEERFAS